MDKETELTETENPEQKKDVELNEDGIPRPAPDPKNGLYTFISLLLFAVLYIGYKFIGNNFFVPYTVTLTEFSKQNAEMLYSETMGIIPENAVLSYARLSYGLDGDRLYLRYEISSKEEFEDRLISEKFVTDNPDREEIAEQRIPVYRNEYSDLDYVYGNIYSGAEFPSIILRVYEYKGRDYAEMVKTDYGKTVRAAFGDGEKIKYKG